MKEIKEIIRKETGDSKVTSFDTVYYIRKKSKIKYWTYGILGGLIFILFLPWTQNIRTRGTITTLRQENRPQELNSIIPGRIVKWHVKEGDYVKKGDTILQLAEVKDAYLDPQLLDRTEEQLQAKQSSIDFYKNKVDATESQIIALQQALELKILQLQNKLQQLQLKVIADSMDMIAATNDYNIAEEQLRRSRIMRDSGLISMVQLEQRIQSNQTTLAKKVSAEIKFTNTKTDLINARIELSQTQQEYAEKLFKAKGEKASAQGEIAQGRGELAKLSNQYANYKVRAGMYYLIAPQEGQIIQAKKSGINEVVKEGEMLAQIVPVQKDLAVEMFVRPVDLPLLSPGQEVRFLFDGFPAIVFSGWPSASYGTFGGKIVAIESNVNDKGMFRVLVGEDRTGKPWPESLKIGTGASGIALIKDVPIWYELWRNINGFPPDYYKPLEENDRKKK